MTGSRRGTAALLLAGLAAGLVALYTSAVESHHLALRMSVHRELLDASIESPFRYRVLAPLLTELMVRAFEPVAGRPQAFQLAYTIWNFAGVFALLWATRLLAGLWLGPGRALLGAVFLALPLWVSFRIQPYAPWSAPEAALFVLGLLALAGQRGSWLLALVVVATLNRETALFLPLAALATACPWPPVPAREVLTRLRVPLAALALWGLTYGILRLVIGPAPRVLGLAETLAQNVKPGNVETALRQLALFLGPAWLLFPLGIRRAPPFLRRACLVILPALVLYAVFGRWREVRILLPLAPLVAVVALFALPGGSRSTSARQGPVSPAHPHRARDDV